MMRETKLDTKLGTPSRALLPDGRGVRVRSRRITSRSAVLVTVSVTNSLERCNAILPWRGTPMAAMEA
jgi:hypothetical protein